MLEFITLYCTLDSVFENKRLINITRRNKIESFFSNYKIEKSKNCIIIEDEESDFYCKVEEFGYFIQMDLANNRSLDFTNCINFLNNILNFTHISYQDTLEISIVSKLLPGKFENPLEQTDIMKKILKSNSDELLIEYSYIDEASDDGLLVRNTLKLLKECISVTTSTMIYQPDRIIDIATQVKHYVNNSLRNAIFESLEV